MGYMVLVYLRKHKHFKFFGLFVFLYTTQNFISG